MYLHFRPLVAISAVVGHYVGAAPAPLGHTAPKYASSRMIYRETPTTLQTKGHDPGSLPHYKKPELPYHGNLTFGDTDDDGPENLSGLSSPSPTATKIIRELGRKNRASLLETETNKVPLEQQNVDFLSLQKTESGPRKLANFYQPPSVSDSNLVRGVWAKQDGKQIPIAEDLAAVNMRLKTGVRRKMLWHVTDEWAYVLKGSLSVSVLTLSENNQTWQEVADVNEGDLWYFPAGVAHSIQAKDTSPEGAEFILIFTSGMPAFEGCDTFLVIDWFAHVPREVTKNFRMYLDKSPFDQIPKHELYSSSSNPPPKDISDYPLNYTDAKNPFTYPLSKIYPVCYPGGTIKIADSRNFEVTRIAVAEFVVSVGGMREFHWHPTKSEWTFIVSGEARITAFSAQNNAATADFFPGDVAYIPPSVGYYITNIGNEPLKFLEVLKTDVFHDVSLEHVSSLTSYEEIQSRFGSDLDVDELRGVTKDEQDTMPWQ